MAVVRGGSKIRKRKGRRPGGSRFFFPNLGDFLKYLVQKGVGAPICGKFKGLFKGFIDRLHVNIDILVIFIYLFFLYVFL